MKLQVLFHDNCFDGAASAAVFSRFYRERVRADVQMTHVGVHHQAGGAPMDPSLFAGDENAIVDFRYSQDPRLTWWFDHHQSAFQMAGDEAHFRADKSGKKFHDPTRKSCTKYMAEICQARFGFDTAPLAELIYWAEIIDGAQFESPKAAVELEAPALKLMTVLEANKDPALIPALIVELQNHTLSEVAQSERIQHAFQPLWEKHQKAIALVRQKAHQQGDIVFFDLGDEGLDSINKFISYYLYPDARYVVWVGRGPARSKVSLGSNPWRPELRKHDLSKLAEKYGGGGHPVVAAISFQATELERARQVASEVVAALSK